MNLFWRYFLSFFLCGLAILATVGIILFGPRKYHSEALLMLRVGHENVRLDPTVTTGETVQVQQNRESEVNTALATLRSRDIATEVMKRVGADPIRSGYLPNDNQPSRRSSGINPLKRLKQLVSDLDPVTPSEDAIEELIGSVQISAPRDSNIVSVEYTTKSPELAQRVVETWVKAFLQRHPQLHRTHGSHEFFVEQSEVLAKQLETARDQLKNIKSAANLLTVAEQQKVLSQQMFEARNRRFALKSSLAASKAKVARLKTHMEAVDELIVVEERTGVANEARDGMRQRLYDLEIEMVNSRLSDEHPTMVALKKQIAQARKIVTEQEQTRKETIGGVNPLQQRIQELLYVEDAAYESVASELEAVNTELTQLTAEQNTLNEKEKLIATVEHRIAILEGRYRSVWEKMEQARIDDALENKSITSVNVVQDATFVQRPVSPNKKLCAVFGLAAAGAGFVGPLLLSQRRRVGPALDRYAEHHVYGPEKDDDEVPSDFEEGESLSAGYASQ